MDLAAVMTMVSHDGWYVRFGAEVVEINRTRARRRSGGRVFYQRKRDA